MFLAEQRKVYSFASLFFCYQTVTKLQTFFLLSNMLVEIKNQVSFKSTLPCICRGTRMQPAFWKTRIPAVAGVHRPYRLYPKASVNAISHALWWRCHIDR